jgi:transcriptional regulator with XRE-family HTH domain
MRFKDKLRKLRQTAGVTQDELAGRAGLPVGTVRNYEQGIRNPPWVNVVRLASALGLSCEAFTECDEVAKPAKASARKSRTKSKG